MDVQQWVQVFNGVTVNATGSVESAVIDLRVGVESSPTPYALSLKVDSAGGPNTSDVQVQVCESQDGTNFDAYSDRADIVSSTLLARPGGPGLYNIYPLTGLLAPFLKFKVTGVASNPADTVLDARLLYKEG